MNQAEKGKIIEAVRHDLEQSAIAIVTHYRGMTVAEMTELRREMHKAGVGYRVVKNTLARRAAKGTEFEVMSDLLAGPTGIAYAQDPVAPAKVLVDFSAKHPTLQVLGGAMNNTLLDVRGIGVLATLPSREVLLAQLLAIMMGPVRNLVGVLSAVPGSLVRVLDQIHEAKAQREAA